MILIMRIYTGVAKASTDNEKVSLAPLKLDEALKGLFAVPDPDTTKPKHEKAKRKKAPPTNKG